MNKRWLKLAAVPLAFSLVAAACGYLIAKPTIRLTGIFLTLVTLGFTIIVMLILLIPCADYTLWNYRIKASALRIPWTYLLMCFPLFIGLTVLHCIIDIVTNIRRFIGKTSEREEVLPWL